MFDKASPARPTCSTPRPTCWVEALIKLLISLAAPEDRCASARTSLATTAKPLPASPARAASTPAFSAKRLVWKAMSSITLMIWLIWSDDLSISVMAETAPATTLPLSSASERAERTMVSTSRARSAAERIDVVSSSSAAAVSSSVAAWVSVRVERSSDDWLISLARERMLSAVSTTMAIVSDRRSAAWLKSIFSAS